MADISVVKLPNNSSYNVKDATARSSISSLTTTVGTKAPLESPDLTGTPTAPTAAAGTNTTQIATTAYVMNAFQANDAMIFKGTIGSSGATVTALPNTHYQGWTYKVATAGTYAGKACEIGDMIICVTDGTAANNDHWAVIQTNIDGAVTGPSSSTADHVVTFSGTTGKVVKDSGYTIAKSVPSDAVFTDTTYSSKTAASGGTDISLVTTGEKYTWNNKTSNTGTVTKVTAGSGLSGGDITTTGTINHASTVTAGTAGTSSSTSGATLAVPYVTYNGTGHITAAGTHTHTVNGLIAYCTTAASTAGKTATCPGYVLTSNRYVVVRITTANTKAAALTLAINSTTAKPIYINGTASSSSNYTLPAGDYIVFYDGIGYQFRTDGFLPTPNLYGGIAYCSTAMTTAAKVATCPGYGLFANRFIYVRMLLANTTNAKLTLSINGTTAKDIYINGKVSSSSNYNLQPGDYLVYYDGTGYQFWTDGAFLADQLYESDAYAITSSDIDDIFS